MELKPGYRRTDMGVIPADWETPKLRACLVQNATYGVVKAGMFQRSGVPMLRGGDINDGVLADELPRISEEKSAEYSRTVLQESDVVIALVGYPGETAVVPTRVSGANISRAVGLLRPGKNLSPAFLTHYLNSPRGRKEFLRPGAGSAQLVVNLKDLNELSIVLPPLTEQHAIAEALDDVDRLRSAIARLITKKRDLKQAVMQQLLTGKTRLPGFGADWDTVRLGELFDFKNGLNKGKESFGTGTPIVNYMDVYSHAAIRAEDLLGRVSVTKQERQIFDVRRGDVFFTRTSETVHEIGVAAVMIDHPAEAVFSGFLLRARPKDEVLRDDFKTYCFASEHVREQIVSRSSYTTRALTNGRLLSMVMLRLPPKAEQAAIATVLSDMDAELLMLEQRVAKTRALKQGMMQELMAGRTRLV